jgi:PAS domain S-box-containing protein
METRGSHNEATSQTQDRLARGGHANSVRTQPDELSQERLSYLRLLYLLIISIFLAEVVAMIVAYALPPLPYVYVTLIDAGIMTILIFPMLYFLSFRPLLHHLGERQHAEEKLRRANDELEWRVQERTEELRIAISELEDEINVRRRTEEALREAAERFRIVADFTHDWEYWRSVDNHFHYISPSCETITGYPREAFHEDPNLFLQIVHPDDRERLAAHYHDDLRRDEPYEIEFRIVRRDGQERWLGHACRLVLDSDGRKLGRRASNRDITERKQAEAALRESEQKFRSAFANAAIGFAMTRPDGPFVDVNPAYCALTGYTLEELYSLEFPSVIHPEDRADNMNLIHKMLGGQIADFVLENRYLRKDGVSVWVRKSVSLVRDRDGNPQWIIALVEDITERKRAEEELRRAHDQLELRVDERTRELAVANRELLREIAERKEIERQLRLQTTTMEAAGNGIVITDDRGNIQWANPAMRQISGYTAQELIGKSTRIFGSGQHNEAYYHQMWDTVLSGQVWRGETINRRKDGSLYMEEQTITPVRSDHGEVTHFIAIKQDITERKQAEENLAQRNVELQIISSAERNQRQFSEALIEAAILLNRSLKLDEVLSLILEQIRGVISYHFANIVFLEGESFYVASHQGDFKGAANATDNDNRFRLDGFPILARMRTSGEPTLMMDLQEEPDWIILQGFEWVRSFLSAPLLVENKVIGFVNLFGDQPRFFTHEMRDRLVAFAAQAGVAIQNAWLFEQVQASTERLQSLSRRLVEIQENERLYISRELHDEAGQVLTSLLVDLRLLEKNAAQPDAILKIVAEMERSLNGVIENLHRIAMALRPASLDHVGLVAALRQHVDSVREKHDIDATFRSTAVMERLPANVETILYRTVQEALTNVIRHAHATRVDVVLTIRDNKLVILVEDDGIGFDPNSVSRDDHLGLFGIRERTEMIGAALVIESEPGRGTTIMLEVDYDNTTIGRR